MTATSYTEPLLAWYARTARDLPWRAADAGPWSVLVSEFMLQQTPVTRVLPAHARWLARWPSAPALAAEPPAEAIREWGRLGYPRRALRLHETARIITARHDGNVPSSVAELRALPGVGSYTAAAIASFAFGQRHAVLDTNVRRVLARLAGGSAGPASVSVSVAETLFAESLLPDVPATAARWSVAVMELGALVCGAATARCGECPLAGQCAWLAAGRPDSDEPRPGGRPGSDQGSRTGSSARSGTVRARRPVQRYEGTDRQCRGRVLAVLRECSYPVPRVDFAPIWPDQAQLDRALAGLVTDGLASHSSHGYTLPAATVS
ncbi:MAG TPA: A/G-specific adenine glycosylase [Streptosporangiaceae bacterium]